MLVPRPAGRQSTVDDVLAVPVEVPHAGHPGLEGLGDQGSVNRNHPRDGGLGDRVDVGQQLLGEIVPQRQQSDLDTAEQPQGARSCRRKVSGTGCVDQFAQVEDLVAVKACGSIHGSGLSFI